MNQSIDYSTLTCSHCHLPIVQQRVRYVFNWDEIFYTIVLNGSWVNLHGKCYREIHEKEE